MTVVRWNPVQQLAAMEVDRLHQMFDDLWARPLGSQTWVPPVDIYETEGHDVVIRIELAGMKREDIQLTVERQVLTISGERQTAPEVAREKYHRVERHVGRFSRSFTLPSTLDTERIGATYQDGILTVTLPQCEEAKPRQITVNVK